MPLALAASVAVCAVVLVFALGVFDRAPPPVVYATGPDQRDTVRLGDGSQPVLNADTTVAVRMGDNQRQLVLEGGEVMFGSSHDSQPPLPVEAGNVTVTALRPKRKTVGK